MKKELSKPQKCLIQRNGVEIWLDNEKANKLQIILNNITEHKFVEFEGRTINTADCTGVYLSKDMEELTHRKNGQWQCNYGTWHNKNERCECGRIPSKFSNEPELKNKPIKFKERLKKEFPKEHKKMYGGGNNY